MPIRHVILRTEHQFPVSVESSTTVQTVCQMTNGKRKLFAEGSPELVFFAEDREAYWRANGWARTNRNGRVILAPEAGDEAERATG